jgi:hypothetical protein
MDERSPIAKELGAKEEVIAKGFSKKLENALSHYAPTAPSTTL